MRLQFDAAYADLRFEVKRVLVARQEQALVKMLSEIRLCRSQGMIGIHEVGYRYIASERSVVVWCALPGGMVYTFSVEITRAIQNSDLASAPFSYLFKSTN